MRDRYPPFSTFLGTTKGSFSTHEHFLHRKRRTAYSLFLSSANVAASDDLIKAQADHCCDLLWHRKNDVLDVRTFFAAFSFDTFYAWAFGSPLGLLDNLELAAYCNEAVETLVTSAPFPRFFPWMMLVARRVPHRILRLLSRHIGRVFDLHEVAISLGSPSAPD